jgi:hypothetical protein
MAPSKSDIEEWLADGQQKGASHLIVVCDQFEYEDYPVYVMPDESAKKLTNHYDSLEMSKVMEVYDLSLDWATQLDEYRAYHVS